MKLSTKANNRFLKMASSLAMVPAFSILETICSTWFGQEEIPKAVLDMEV